MAQKQSYKNHVRWYPPHHFIFYPFMLAFLCGAVYLAFNDASSNKLLWLAIGMLAAVVIWLSFMLRQHYALTLQNRLVVQEMRYRYYVVTGERLEPLEQSLTEGQLFALRFAPDEEFKTLTKRAIQENLSPKAIKKSIEQWHADTRRV